MHRFKLSLLTDLIDEPNIKWEVTDDETGICISFFEGLFNETQNVIFPFSLTQQQHDSLPDMLNDVSNFLTENHRDVAFCNPVARYRAICSLPKEIYWITLADAMQPLTIDWDDKKTAEVLYEIVNDYIFADNSVHLSEPDAANLRGSLLFFSDEEALEVINIVSAFWKYKSEDKFMTIEDWALGLLWWPTFCPKHLISPRL